MGEPAPQIFSEQAIAKTIEEQMRAVVDAFARAYVPAIQRIVEAMRPLIELANSPQGQAMIADYRRRRALGLDVVAGCHCLCQVRHPDVRLCLGEFPSREIVTVRIAATNVPMCPRCARYS
jgi:hypothetical protein